VALTRITGVLVCEVGRRDNWYDAYIYTLARETCPGDTPSGGPGCHRHAPLPVFTPPRRVADYTTALSLVHIPTTTNGAETLDTLQPGALMEVVGSHITNHNNHGLHHGPLASAHTHHHKRRRGARYTTVRRANGGGRLTRHQPQQPQYGRGV